jgi:hypothetical protein
MGMSAEDDADFRAYVASRQRALRRVALLMCGDWDRADDLVQTALTKLYVAWHRVNNDRGPDAYAHRSLANVVIDERRRPWRRESPWTRSMIARTSPRRLPTATNASTSRKPSACCHCRLSRRSGDHRCDRDPARTRCPKQLLATGEHRFQRHEAVGQQRVRLQPDRCGTDLPERTVANAVRRRVDSARPWHVERRRLPELDRVLSPIADQPTLWVLVNINGNYTSSALVVQTSGSTWAAHAASFTGCEPAPI